VNFGIGVSWLGTFKKKKKLLKISIFSTAKILKGGKTLQIYKSLNLYTFKLEKKLLWESLFIAGIF
jgi:hypothetical protein